MCVRRGGVCALGWKLRATSDLAMGNGRWATGNGRMLPGGYAARATMTLELVTNKGQRQKDYHFKHAISPNALVMVRCSTVRILRMLVLRGALQGCHSRKPTAVAAAVEAADFTGLRPDVAGFVDFSEMAAACAEFHWAKWPGSDEWAFICNVCIDTGVIEQRNSYGSKL